MSGFDADTGEIEQVLEGRQLLMTSVAFSFNGTRVVSGSDSSKTEHRHSTCHRIHYT